MAFTGTATLSLRARCKSGLADKPEHVVRRRTPATRRVCVRVTASSRDGNSKAPGTSEEYNEMMQKAMGNPYR